MTLKEETFINSYHLWSDSMISLAWINAYKKEFKPFVENRVNVIRSLVQRESWNYCITKKNPADIITRFNNIDLRSSNMWWDGLKLLYNRIEKNSHVFEDENKFRVDDPFLDEYNNEIKKNCSVNLVLNDTGYDLPKVIDINKLSSSKKLYVITALVIRFIDNLKRKVNGKTLKLDFIDNNEVNNAKNLWLKANQNELIKNQQHFKDLENSLRLVKDNHGIYRSEGRLKNANTLPYETRSPILLARNHKLTELIVLDCHFELKHAGQRQTLTELRTKYWIIKGKSYIKFLLHRCAICKRYNSRAYAYPKSPDLPAIRVTESHAYNTCGIDYIGPLYTKDVYYHKYNEEDEVFKAYIKIYTSPTTRGVF